MKVGYYQFMPEWKNPRATLQKIKQRLKGEKFDLLVLPELFTTGYLLSEKEIWKFAEDLEESRTIDELSKISASAGGYICGSILEKDDDDYLYNTAIFVGPDGLEGSYRKHHLPDIEKVNLSSSWDDPKLFDLGDAKAGALICFDLWFPELTRIMTRKGLQLLCHPAAFGGADTPDIVRIRAIENRVFIVSANLIGEESDDLQSFKYRGASRIVSPEGLILAESGENEDLLFLDLNPEDANHKKLSFCDNLWSEWNHYKTEFSSNAQP
ncbi:MAG: carbon-nitrogen hydrolase family protein [Bacteroidales bacterium]|jgi:predicted amidohydrolase|nr:carbon-nitrogen hydrolase family protein [Bacteroidales bacterium]MDD3666099.1 carbon-nitrogen hydrolase family protein [Bacteroidales bacterium]